MNLSRAVVSMALIIAGNVFAQLTPTTPTPTPLPKPAPAPIPAPKPATAPALTPSSSPEAVVRAYFEAFNRQDIDALVATVAEDFIWYSIENDKMSIEASGRESFRMGVQDYFKALPAARSVAETMTASGPYVSVRERPSWTTRTGEKKSQVAITVYEERNGLIKRVWYYPPTI
ncbi:MAG: nuclear transport factor 2 family protein [Burkholderiales bacterium]|nr:nuclear transport factor 2 family protein [Burkholderiales bacterium]